MKNILSVILMTLMLFPIQVSSQLEEFRIITRKLDTLHGNQRYDGKKVIIVDAKGEINAIKPGRILSIRRQIQGWNYYEWGLKELKVPVHSMSQKQLFIRAQQWIKENYIKCPCHDPENQECGILFERDSIMERDSMMERDSLIIKDLIKCGEKNTPEPKGLKDYSCIDYENYVIKLVSYNKGGLGYSVPGLWSSPLTMYSISLTFNEGEIIISPIQMCYIWSEEDTRDPTEDYGLLDNLFLSGKIYYSPIPLLNTKNYNNKSGIIKQNLRCLVTHIEVLFNDINRSLYNYLLDKKEYSDMYIHYRYMCGGGI